MTTPTEAGIVTLDGEVTYAVLLDNAGHVHTFGDFPHCRMHRPADRKPRCTATCRITDRDGTSAERCTRERRHGGVHVHHHAPGQPILAWRTTSEAQAAAASPTSGTVMCVLCNETGPAETDLTKPEARRTALAWAWHFATHHPDAATPVTQHIVMIPDAPDQEESNG